MIRSLTTQLEKAFEAEGMDPSLVTVIACEKPEIADMQCNGVRPAAALTKQNPRELAERIISHLQDPNYEFEVSGPGFINIKVQNGWLNTSIALPTNNKQPKAGRRAIIDFGGPNVAKPMHVGHLRSLVIGDSLQRIFRFVGKEVISDIHLGDWGFQMGLLLAYLEGAPLHSITIDVLEEAYPLASARAKVDEPFRLKALSCTKLLQSGDHEFRTRWTKFVQVSLDTINRELASLNIGFTVYYGESDAQPLIADMIDEFVDRGIAKEDTGALVVEGAEGEPPLILRKSDGASLYATTDLATIKFRMDRWAPDRIIYVTDERQQLHFKQVFEAASKIGYAQSECLEHVWFGTVNDINGKPLKTRSGGVPKLVDLIAEATEKAAEKNPEAAHAVAIAALKFADLQNYRKTAYTFDLAKFLSFEGKTGPYLLYQAVRIKSALAKATVAPGEIIIQNEQERRLAFKMLYGFPAAIDRAVARLSPKEIADYVYDLAQTFSKFYTLCPIADDPSRVALSIKVLDQIELCLELLGITVPDRM